MIKFENALIILNKKQVTVQLCRNIAYILHSEYLAEEVSFHELARILQNVEILKHSRSFWKVLQNRLQ